LHGKRSPLKLVQSPPAQQAAVFHPPVLIVVIDDDRFFDGHVDDFALPGQVLESSSRERPAG